MQNEERIKKKKDILGDIFLNEEDVLKELSDLVSLAKPFFMIEQETGNIIFNHGDLITNEDKIFLLLVGKFFSKERGIIKNDLLTIAEISNQLRIPKTTLSAPLGRLISKGFIKKIENSYNIVYHKIKMKLIELSNKKESKSIPS